MEHTIVCPGCAKPLHVPAEALAKPMSCPHCRTNIHVPVSDDGTLGTPEKVKRSRIPEILLAPMYLLMTLGFAGTAVNGYLSAQFYNQPLSQLEFARTRVHEYHMIESISTIGGDDPMSVDGLSMIGGTIVPAAEDELLAQKWATGMKPIHTVSTGLSFLALLGGLCILLGRFYWLALLGCVAAILNVNHLCCLPGGIAGLWGILVLVRDEPRLHFGIVPKTR